MNVALATNEKARPKSRAVEKAERAPPPTIKGVGFVTVEGRSLAAALRLMAEVVERRNTYPILGCVRLKIGRASLKVSGTDLDIEAVATLDVIDAGGKWSTCVDCRTLAAISRAAGVMPVRLAPGPNNELLIEVGDGDATYELNCLSDESFPSIAGERGDVIETFTNGLLGATLDKVVDYVSDEETRYYLNGVAWQCSGDARRLAATDGHRMAVCRYAGKSFGAVDKGEIIPKKVVGILRHQTMGADVAVHRVTIEKDGATTVAEHKLEFVWPGFVLRAKMIEGAFPDIDRVIPKADKIAFSLPFKLVELKAALDRVRVMGAARSNSRFTSVGIKFERKDGRVVLSHRNLEYGTAHTTLSTTWPEVQTQEFGVNGRYLSQLLAGCQGDTTFAGVDAGTAFRITDADETMLRLLMPMRV